MSVTPEAPTASDPPTVAAAGRRSINEDWAATIIGLLLIGLVLAGLITDGMIP